MILDAREVKKNPSRAAVPLFGIPLRTLDQDAFENACAQLMRQVEQAWSPDLMIGIRTGGLVVARAMARHASTPIPVLPLTSRRASTGAKARLPFLRPMLSVMPGGVVDTLRRLEHRWLIAPRARRVSEQHVDEQEAAAIGQASRDMAPPPRLLIVDDAVDSGVTLLAVSRRVRAVAPADAEIRVAVITQTLPEPMIKPDHALYRGVLCRFPWSFDAG